VRGLLSAAFSPLVCLHLRARDAQHGGLCVEMAKWRRTSRPVAKWARNWRLRAKLADLPPSVAGHCLGRASESLLYAKEDACKTLGRRPRDRLPAARHKCGRPSAFSLQSSVFSLGCSRRASARPQNRRAPTRVRLLVSGQNKLLAGHSLASAPEQPLGRPVSPSPRLAAKRLFRPARWHRWSSWPRRRSSRPSLALVLASRRRPEAPRRAARVKGDARRLTGARLCVCAERGARSAQLGAHCTQLAADCWPQTVRRALHTAAD